jgi:membrane protein DedA with SNARE-associated domain
MEIGLALACCLVGALLGDCVMYAIGYHFGRSVLQEHRWFARFLTPQREARIERMIQEHGIKMFLMARFMVGLRSPVYLTSGILRVPFRRFIFIDTICASIVIGIFFALSYVFAPHIQMVWQWIRGAEYTLTGLVLAAICAGVYWYVRKRRQRFDRVMARRRRRVDRAAASEAPVVDAAVAHDATVRQEASVEPATRPEPPTDPKRVALRGNVAAADLHSSTDGTGNPSHAAVD